MHKLIGDGEIGIDALDAMRSRKGKWAAYQNNALDSFSCGDLKFLQYGGPDNTFSVPPTRYPDTSLATGWKYLHCGYVNLETGKIVEQEVT